MTHTLASRTSSARHRLSVSVLAVVSLLVTGLLAAVFGSAPPSGAAVAPQLVVSVATDNAGLDGGAVPNILADINTDILVTLSLSDGTELAKGTVVELKAFKQLGDAAATGSFDPPTFTVPQKGASFTFPVQYSIPQTDIYLKASPRKSNATSPTPGRTVNSFDILATLRFADKVLDAQTLASGFGADTCTSASTAKVCGIVVLPQGISSQRAALSSGLCSEDTGCGTNEMVQFIAGMEGYSRTSPATLVLRCDKTKCKGKGVSSYDARISLEVDGPLDISPPCAVKGQIQDGEDFCTDYVSSKRDNAGDLLLQILFFRDLRGMI